MVDPIPTETSNKTVIHQTGFSENLRHFILLIARVVNGNDAVPLLTVMEGEATFTTQQQHNVLQGKPTTHMHMCTCVLCTCVQQQEQTIVLTLSVVDESVLS
jgi:hypothetical protein